MRTFNGIDDLKAAVGQELGTSSWREITQEMVNQFADATDDHQWIHVDVERAKAGPFGAPIAHGFLTLSLISTFGMEVWGVDGVQMIMNYGSNKTRFTNPVRVGSRVRAHITLVDVVETPNGYQVTSDYVVEIDGEERPALYYQSLALVVP